MGAKALVPDKKWLIERIAKDAQGRHPQTVYTGARRNKPKGWRIVREIR